MKDEFIHEKYGEMIWRFIPVEWRPWWIDVLKEKFPFVFGNITITKPSAVFQDRTLHIKEWETDINSYLLSRLKSTSNKYLMPTVKCPWGCSEFPHKVGYLPLDIIFQRYLQKCSLKTFTKKPSEKYAKVISAREDYIHDEGDQDVLIFNPLEWSVLPSIAFIKDKGPQILTCSEHNGGTGYMYIHPCRWKHNLSSKRPDQLCQAVVTSSRYGKVEHTTRYSQ